MQHLSYIITWGRVYASAHYTVKSHTEEIYSDMIIVIAIIALPKIETLHSVLLVFKLIALNQYAKL